jgi:Holliday junction resolvase
MYWEMSILKNHEQLLQCAINAMENQGYRVIRLDRREIPDAIAIGNNEIVAIEAETNPSGVWLLKKNFEKSHHQYDSEIVVANPLLRSRKSHSKEEYFRVLELRKGGCSYTEIQTHFQFEFNKHLCRSLIHKWVRGKSKPPAV